MNTAEVDQILEEGKRLAGFTFSHRKSDLRVDCGVYRHGNLTYIIDESREEIVTSYPSERPE